MAKKIEAGANFKLCSSPTIEAVEMVDKLSSRDDRVLKMATYTLQRLIRETPFTDEFVARGGVKELLNVIRNHSSGNTLAYALTSCQNLMEGFEYGWVIIDSAFVAKVVGLLVTQERINVCRPATAILKKLVVLAARLAKDKQVAWSRTVAMLPRRRLLPCIDTVSSSSTPRSNANGSSFRRWSTALAARTPRSSSTVSA